MNTFFGRVFRSFVVAGSVALLVSSAFAQVKLRDAMDTDGDDKADFTIFRPENNVWYIQNGGGFVFQQFGLTGQDYMAPGDYDGDGKGDISVWRDSDGVWYRLNSSDSTFTAVQFGISGDEPVARDYDGDGKTDQAVVRRTDGNMIWYVLKSSDFGFIAAQFGLSTDFTAPGDYDGDGKFDFAVQRPGETATSQATFYALNSADSSLMVVPWGFSTDLVAPGDYDGDGKTDLAVVREGASATDNLIWYVLLSADNSFMIRSFGLTGIDYTTQNDYDGDGKTDMAIWRDTEGTFYVLRSTDLGLTVNHWGQANDFPVAAYDTH
ncbi:MAG: hypothetical protein R2684_01965 [Pyrinomonadaceae bacterium]